MMTSYGQFRVLPCILLFVAGCRHASVQDDPNWPSPGPVDVASLPPIQSVINRGTSDPDSILASRNQDPARATSNPSQRSGGAEPIMLGAVGSPKAAESSSVPVAGQTPQVALIETPQAQPEPVSANPLPLGSQTAALPPVASSVENAASPLPVTPSAESVAQPLPPVSQNTGQKSDPQTQTASNQQDEQPKAAPAAGQGPLAAFSMEGLPPTAVSAGRVAATVGKEIITVYDLNIAVQDWIKQNVPAGQSIPRRDGLMISRMVLNQMVDRMLIVQEAHRMMKSDKQKDALLKQIERVWVEQQIPPMMKKNKVESTYELDQVLRKQGRSLDSAKKEFMNDAVAHEFMGMKLSGKTYVSLVDMRRYYNTHLTEFDRPAQLTWREIRIPIEAGNKQAAEEKAKSILQQVQANQDFATLAKTAGKGPTADQGGLWETSPGGFALQEINQALASLKPGQVAGPIGTEQAFHIVKLETSREAGPARFDEVQTDIQNKLRNEKLGEASMGFVKDLRKQAVVVTIFDSLPQMAMPGSDNQVQKTNTLNSPASPLAPTPAVVNPTLQQPSGTPSAQSVPQESAGGSSSSSGLHGKLGSPHASPVLSEDIPSTLAPAGPTPTRGIMAGPSGPSPL